MLIYAGEARLLCAQAANSSLFEVSATQSWFGTRVDLLAQHESIQACKQAFYEAFREMARLEKLFGAEMPESEMRQINQQAGHTPVKVSAETLGLIKRAAEYAQKFSVALEVAAQPREELGGARRGLPNTKPELMRNAACRALADYAEIIIDERDTTIAFKHADLQLALGDIVRGYAIDRAAAILKQQGIKNFLITADGDIYAAGRKDENQKWCVGIQHPRHPNALMASFDLSDGAVATNSAYDLYGANNDQRDPARPCQSVSVLAASAEEAEAWAAYLFAIGFEAYKKIATPQTPAALFVDADGRIHWEAVWEKNYRLKFWD